MDYFGVSYKGRKGYDYEEIKLQINDKLQELKLQDSDIITIDFNRYHYKDNGSYGGYDTYTLSAMVFYKTKQEYQTIVKD